VTGRFGTAIFTSMLHVIFLTHLALVPIVVAQERLAPQTSIVGELRTREGKSFLIREGAEVPLASVRAEVNETLADERLAGREFKLVGRFLADGQFDVTDFFVFRNGKLLRLVYFCETCNITTFAPGLCACCGQPTLPVEVPLNDPRVYHPGDDVPPER
jgi:hypothetical protein